MAIIRTGAEAQEVLRVLLRHYHFTIGLSSRSSGFLADTAYEKTALHTVVMKCPRCEASNCSKNGHKNGKQLYFCKRYPPSS